MAILGCIGTGIQHSGLSRTWTPYTHSRIATDLRKLPKLIQHSSTLSSCAIQSAWCSCDACIVICTKRQRMDCDSRYFSAPVTTVKHRETNQQIEHHARPRLASATAPLRTGPKRAKQKQARAVAAGQKQCRTAGVATMSGQRTKQESEGSPTLTRMGAGKCTPQITYQAGTPRQEPNTATS